MNVVNEDKNILQPIIISQNKDDNDDNEANKVLTLMNQCKDSPDNIFFNSSEISSDIFNDSSSSEMFSNIDLFDDDDYTYSEYEDDKKSLFDVNGFMRNIYEMKFNELAPNSKVTWPFKESDLDIKPWSTKHEKEYDTLLKENNFIQKKLSNLYNDIHLRMYFLDIIETTDLLDKESLDNSLCYWVFNQFKENATEDSEKEELNKIENIAFNENKEQNSK
tara:strand:- start:321 stop:980 length:660 start_codon:yes stop_codon:yes gene_type:complete